MASHGDFSKGNQLFFGVFKENETMPTIVDVRGKYTDTFADVKARAAKKLGVSDPSLIVAFVQGKQLYPEEEAKTILGLDLHTGFAVRGFVRGPGGEVPAAVGAREGDDGRLVIW